MTPFLTRYIILAVVLLKGSSGKMSQVALGPLGPLGTESAPWRRLVREEGRRARYLSHRNEEVRWEEPQSVESDSSFYSPDKFQVVSSSLRVLPRKRSRREAGDWRKPRRHQFVTSSRLGKYLEPERLRYYPEERRPSPRRAGGGGRRIIYYATLPEIVRRPAGPEWAAGRPRYDGYPSPTENEVTRVQSPLIDVGQRDKYSPAITIIDAEPPYLRYRRPPPFDPYYFYDLQRDRYPFDDPYRYYPYERRPPPPPPPPQRSVILPPLPNSFTVLRKPLDVRPLDPITDATTSTETPEKKRVSTSKPTTTTTLNPIAKFERRFKY